MPELSDLSSGTTFKNLLIAAFVGAAIILLAQKGAEKFLVTAKEANVKQNAPSATAPPSQEEAYREEERIATLAKQARQKKEQELLLTEQVKREKKLQEALAARELATEQARKETAWRHFYKKPKKCDNPNDNSLIVECGNHFIREQQRFEKLYSDGKL